MARARWPQALQVAVFDTAFHASLPEHARVYAVPRAWRALGIRRYGFLGLSHEYVMQVAAKAFACTPETLRIVSGHIGNGASVCAIDRGRSVDVAMGLTALAGLVMGTRSGDGDPGALLYVARQLGLSLDAIEEALYHDSGLKSLSGISSDLREIEQAARHGNPAARLALQVHAYRVRKYIGAYVAVMGGVDVVAVTGGGGENSPELRARILTGLEFLGIQLDPARNATYRPDIGDVEFIQQDVSPVKVLAVHAREQWMLARAAADLLVVKQ
jgi:acetate kinase